LNLCIENKINEYCIKDLINKYIELYNDHEKIINFIKKMTNIENYSDNKDLQDCVENIVFNYKTKIWSS
jgi:hypothetical protein